MPISALGSLCLWVSNAVAGWLRCGDAAAVSGLSELVEEGQEGVGGLVAADARVRWGSSRAIACSFMA